MAIGKPLLVSERKGVAQPVLSAQTQQLSSNVPVQKIAMADYSIGMNNAMSSFAVTKELVNMVDAGVKAKMYIDQTKQQYARLNLMEDWNKVDNDFRLQFSKAMTPEEQQEVITRFDESIQSRTDNYRKGGGLGLPTSDSVQAQRDLSSLRTQSQNMFSKMHTTMAANINKRTNSMLDLRVATALKDATTNKNADPISLMNTIKESLEQKVKIGGTTPERAVFDLDVATNKMVIGRGTLFAKDLARQQIANGTPPLSRSQVQEHFNNLIGLKLTDEQVRLLDETTLDTYYKELAVANTQENAEETYAWNSVQEEYGEFKNSVIQDAADGLLSEENIKSYLEKAKAYNNVKAGTYAQIEQIITQAKYGAPVKSYVDYWTTGQGGEVLRKLADNPDTDKTDGYYDLKAIQSGLEEESGKLGYDGLNIKTKSDIIKFFENANIAVTKDLGKQGESISKGIMSKFVRQNPDHPITLAMQQDPDTKDKFFKAMTATGAEAIGWKDVVNQSPVFGQAWQAVQMWKDTQVANKSGPFSPENMDRPFNERYDTFRTALETKLMEEFTKSIGLRNAEMKAKSEAEAKQAQQVKINKQSEHAKMIHEQFKKRRIRPRNIPDISEPPKWVDFIDRKLIPDVGPVDWGGVKESLYDSFSVGYTTALVNKGMRKQIEKDIGRPLTPEELAGENVAINKIATKYIEAQQHGPLGHIGDFLSDMWHTVPFTGDYQPTKEQQYESLVEDFVNESARRIELGIESYKPTAITDEKRDRIDTPDALAQPEQVSDTLSNIVSSVGSLLSPSEASAASISQDTPDNLNPGNRFLTADNEFAEQIPQEVWNRLPKHTLSEGDNLSMLADQYGVTVEELQQLNPQTLGRERVLQIGEQIALPSSLGQTPQASTPTEPSAPPPQQQPVNPTSIEEHIMSREATTAEAIADVGSGIDPDGVGYGHTATESDKELWSTLDTEGRKAQAREWLNEDIAKARKSAEKQIAGRNYSPAFKDTLTLMNFQLGAGWVKKFPSAWAGFQKGEKKGTTPMFKNKTGWEQAIYHIMHANEKSNKPSKWLVQSPKRVMDAVMAIHFMATEPPTEDVISYIDNILGDI